MSPGSSTHSWVGLNSRSSLSSTSLRNSRGGHLGSTLDLPAPLALRLQQEHVVLVDVRADRAARCAAKRPSRRRCASPAGSGSRQQGGDIGVPLVHVLHQQCPVVVRAVAGTRLRRTARAQRQRSCRGRARPGATARSPRRPGRPGLRARAATRSREGVADQQRPLLPVVAQELAPAACRGRAARGIDFDRQRAALPACAAVAR